MNEQPNPTPSTGDLWQELIDLMHERRAVGIERYKTPLQPNNGRNALRDALEESLDKTVYLHQHAREMQQLGDELRAILDRTTCLETYDRLKAIIQRYPCLAP